MLNAGGEFPERRQISAHATSHLRCAAASAILVLLDRSIRRRELCSRRPIKQYRKQYKIRLYAPSCSTTS
jgi:hypothetical protein